MKRTILLLIAIASVTFSSIAQDNNSTTTTTTNNTVENRDSRNKLKFGIKAGANYSNVYDTQGDDFQAVSKVGFVGGAFLSIPLGKYLGIQPEVLFSQKGFKATGNVLDGPYDLTRTTNYLDIPLFLALKPAPFLTLLAGPQFSYLIKQKDVFANATTSVEREQEFKNENVRKNTLCFVGGIDINIDHLVIGARAGWDIQNNNGDGSSTTPRYKNVWLQGTVGIRF